MSDYIIDSLADPHDYEISCECEACHEWNMKLKAIYDWESEEFHWEYNQDEIDEYIAEKTVMALAWCRTCRAYVNVWAKLKDE